MPASSTGTILRTAAHILNYHGLHTGKQFATHDGRLDITAAIFRAATGKTPNCFLTDENASLLQIQVCEPAMDAIRMVSAVLPTEPSTDPAAGRDDHIEHVSNWAGPIRPGADAPTHPEVIGVLLRAAQAADSITAFPHQTERSAA
ncbi:hypothetical protein PV677_36265 [Streptomyces sp. DE06-01C]|uniref:DUF6197 family protein n=1 Tax=Streptomyces sp. DE06-01C TaxID=3028656 RepID=UPI0029C52286|nr:hypothetical protein [Streptomyces sp. DE06-01C]MDX5526127.1 hypothetical protein [Streptomyces sp. DE06-01C]